MLTRTAHLILFGLIGISAGNQAWALPQFGIQFGPELHTEHAHDDLLMTLDCRACHINPTGGGMRNAHGREFSIERLPIQEKTAMVEKAVEAAQINPYFSIGTDLRFAYLKKEVEGGINQDRFFPMQADLYVAFIPTEQLTFYYQDGVEASESRETFLLLQRLPFNSHIKAGRFIPPYGLKLDDHTSFIRDKLGFGAPSFGQDAGLEMGFGERHWFGNAAVFNGDGPYSDSSHAKGISATGGWKSSVFWFAGSYYNNESPSVEKTYAGWYGALHLWRLTLLGEWDRMTAEATTETVGSVTYAELDFKVYRGIVAKIKYDGYDPDNDISDDELKRVTLGMDLYPYPFTEVLIQYRKNIEDPTIHNDQFIAMLHLFY